MKSGASRLGSRRASINAIKAPLEAQHADFKVDWLARPPRTGCGVEGEHLQNSESGVYGTRGAFVVVRKAGEASKIPEASMLLGLGGDYLWDG